MRYPRLWSISLLLLLMIAPAAARAAGPYTQTINRFRNAGQSADFFKTSYGYAVFPTIGKAGLGLGGAHGKGRVYRQGVYTGNATMTQVSVGWQAGVKAYSEIVFFENEEAYNRFTSGSFAFGAEASAVAITAGASVRASTDSPGASASTSSDNAATAGGYTNGMAVFTVAKGGLMYEASLNGQKFGFQPLKKK
jgi:lipid-binding SYLF domain-containing protein